MPSKLKLDHAPKQFPPGFQRELIEALLEDVKGLEVLQRMQSQLLAEIRREVTLLERSGEPPRAV